MAKFIGVLVILIAVVGGAGYYVGRQSVLEQRPPTVVMAPPPLPSPTSQTRSRTRVETPDVPASPEPRPVSTMDPHVSLPITGLTSKDLRDTFNEARGTERKHEAQDILAPRGTPVLAVDNGVVKKLFLSKPGGITLYQFDPSERYCYYYAHLERYAEGVKEGMKVTRGQLLGYVGSTGNADPGTPHLHFAIFELGPDKQWWKGTPVNPYPLLTDALSARR